MGTNLRASQGIAESHGLRAKAIDHTSENGSILRNDSVTVFHYLSVIVRHGG